MMKFRAALGIFMGLMAGTAMAETTSATPGATTPTPAQASTAVVEAEPSKLIGAMELRSYFEPSSDKLYTDNYAEVGYKFTKDTSVSYVQFFSTNLYDPSGATSGMNLSFPGGFLRAKINNIYKFDDTLSLSYQPRAYLPLTQADRDAGMVTILRNYFTFTKKVSSNFSVSFVELPMLHVYSKSGTISDGKASANAWFENRFYLIGSLTLTDKLSLSMPLYYHAKLHRGFGGAENSGKVTHYFYTWPELAYQMNDAAYLSLAYVSGNLIEADFSGFTVGQGLGDGSVQVALGMSL